MTFAERLRAGESVVGTWLTLPCGDAAEAVAGAGFDFAVVDTEHAPVDAGTATEMLRGVAAAPGETAGLVRVAETDPTRIKRALDAGPAGVVVPMVDTAEAARAAVAACEYPPEGVRGVAAARAADYGRSFERYVGEADPLTVVQLESEAAVENAAEIAAVDGVDALFVGPADLSAALGEFPDWDGPVVGEAIEAVLGAGADADVPVGTLAAGPGEVSPWLERGFDFLAVGVDAGMLAGAADDAVAAFEAGTDG
jgi:2-keto-3-deoxy-L-rhamnonate aldolase RhmA